MRTDSFQALNGRGLHRVVYREWGAQDNQRVLICVHGLARNSRDFDDLARVLMRDYRVVCPDIVGRGDSDWLPEGADYGMAQYLGDMVALIARLGVDKVDWLGTSMGGLIGMSLAALPNSPIRRLVLNDIGPFVPAAALQRISQYVAERPLFDELAQVEAFLRRNYPALTGLDTRQWRHLSQAMVRPDGAGRLRLHYDPRIALATKEQSAQDVDLWALWQSLRCPQMLIWGEDSDVLTRGTVDKMCEINPGLQVQSVPGVAHAPSLMVADQIRAVQAWLRQPLNECGRGNASRNPTL